MFHKTCGMYPIRCFTCGKVFPASVWEYYENRTGTDHEALDTLKITRICCRRMIMTSINLESTLLAYPTHGKN